ncbi:hypothetical protein O3Q51_18180 [Cryomorphaceae bacterium 1068]|nr:hypothetical protein [Cryomorphaceae bacterium 1068]
MKWFDDIKKAWGRRKLLSKINKSRETAVSNFHNAHSVAILYEEKGESYYILVKQYVKYLKSEFGVRDVLALCYIDDKKEVPHYHTHRLKFDYFLKSELNWWYEPSCDQVKNFVANPYDILINLERTPSLPLEFIQAESNARLKVGYYNPDREDHFDLMLDLPEKATFDEFVKQVNHYLTRINYERA